MRNYVVKEFAGSVMEVECRRDDIMDVAVVAERVSRMNAMMRKRQSEMAAQRLRDFLRKKDAMSKYQQ